MDILKTYQFSRQQLSALLASTFRAYLEYHDSFRLDGVEQYLNYSAHTAAVAEMFDVERGKRSGYVAMDLFASVEHQVQPYSFQPGVDYTCLDGELWKCGRCERDYNGLTVPVVPDMIPGDPRGSRPTCPHCGGWPAHLFVMQPGQSCGSYFLLMHGRMVEQYRQFCPERIAYLLEQPKPEKRKRAQKATA